MRWIKNYTELNFKSLGAYTPPSRRDRRRADVLTLRGRSSVRHAVHSDGLALKGIATPVFSCLLCRRVLSTARRSTTCCAGISDAPLLHRSSRRGRGLVAGVCFLSSFARSRSPSRGLRELVGSSSSAHGESRFSGAVGGLAGGFRSAAGRHHACRRPPSCLVRFQSVPQLVGSRRSPRLCCAALFGVAA